LLASGSFMLAVNARMAAFRRRFVLAVVGAPSSACSAPASASRAHAGPDDVGASGGRGRG